MKPFDLHRHSTERISQRVLYVLIGLAVVLVGLYYVVGFDNRYTENPDFNEPLLTDWMLGFMYALLSASIAVALWALMREVRCRGNDGRNDNGIPVRLIGQCVAGGTVAVLALTFVLSSTQTLVMNGRAFTDKLLLRVADQFIYTSAILLSVAVAAVIYGMTKYYRKASDRHVDTTKTT